MGEKGMASPRDNRLNADYQKVRKAVEESGGTLKLVRATGNPPTRYVIEYHCPGLARDDSGQIITRHTHQVEIALGANYPLPGNSPRSRLLTPAFNPHIFTNQDICLGDWSPTETLDVLVLRLGALLQWDPRVIKPTSPANGEAMNWYRAHKSQFPLGKVTFKASDSAESRIAWHKE
jgi:ubiquitin-protein ligase